MHDNHDIFMEGIAKSRAIELTYSCEGRGRSVVTRCAPLHFSEGRDRDDKLGCYYFWQLDPPENNHFLPLQTPEIVAMELTDQDFRIREIISQSKAKTD